MGLGRWGIVLVGAAALTACGGDDATTSTGPGASAVQEYEATMTIIQQEGEAPVLCYFVLTSLPPQCDDGLPVVGLDWSEVDGEEQQGTTTWGSAHVVGTYGPDGLTLTRPPGPAQESCDVPDGSEVNEFAPACDEPDVVDAAQGAAEWEALSQDYGPFDPPNLVAAWSSDPAGDWDGPYVANLVVLPGSGDAALALVREHYDGAVCIVERDGPTAAELRQIQEELNDADATAALGPVGSSAEERRGVVVAEVWVADDAAVAYATERWGDLVELNPLLRPVA